MTKEKMDIYQIITDQIIERLEKGDIVWQKPWINGGAVSWKTQKAYRGVNTLLLEPGEYITFNQAKLEGGKIRKGAKSKMVIFWKFLEKENEGEVEKIPLLRYYRVFNINDVEGIESKRVEQEFNHDPIEEAENIVKGYMGKPKITNESGTGAWYKPFMDHVNVPPMKDFPKLEEYYNTMFHELLHSTGSKDRLNRSGVIGVNKFGSEDYSKEELVAEIGANMLSGIAGFNEVTFENTVAYIQSWIRVLKNDKTLIVKASGEAQRGVDHILGISFNKGGEE